MVPSGPSNNTSRSPLRAPAVRQISPGGPNLALFGSVGRPPGAPVQATVMRALQVPFVLPECSRLLNLKLKVTLAPDQYSEIHNLISGFQWLSDLIAVLQEVKIHTRVVWLKTVCGAWTTSHRMHEEHQLPCFYGCVECNDTLTHYLQCPILWQLAREAIPFEESSSIAHRLALTEPTTRTLNRLAIAFSLYHNTKNDHVPFDSDLNFSVPNFVQHRAACVASSLKSQFGE